jgi:DNA-binding SARP family transcriptional activator/LysM repeat protein
VRRARAGLGLAAILTGVPAALLSLLGPPRVPSFEGSEGLSGSYVPVDAVLGILGILGWSLWAYLAFAVLLSALAELATRRKLPAASALVAASLLLTPKVVRRLVEMAVGGVFVAASLTGSLGLRSPLPEAAAIATVDHTAPLATLGTASSEAPDHATYRVRSGDSLWRIAERELGSGFRWRQIFRLNKDRSFANGHRLTNPHLIYPGWDLALPAQGRTSRVLNRDGGGAQADRGTAPEDEEPIAPSPAASEEGPPDGGNGPEPSPEDFEQEESEPRLPRQSAIRLPSGIVVAASFASGLLTAHLLGRLRQRQGRRVADAPDLSEPALTADLRRAGASPMAGTLDVALHAVAKAWRQHRAVWPRILAALEGERLVRVLISDDGGGIPPAAGGHISASVRFARANAVVQADVEGPFPALLRRALAPLERGVLVPIGRAADGSVVHVGLVSMGTLSVGGAQADALARQLVLASTAQGSPEDVRIIFLGRADGLRLAEALPSVSAYDWEEAAPALREIQAELLRRARLFFDEGVEDVWGHLAAHPDERLPGLVVVAAEPPGALRGVVEAFGREGPSLGAGLLPLGWRPAHSVMHAEVGSLSGLDLLSGFPCPRRLSPLVLDEDATAQAVDVLLRAFPKAQDSEPESEASEAEALSVETPVPGDASSSPSSSGAATEPVPPPWFDGATPPPGQSVTLPVSDLEDWPSEPSAPGQLDVPTPPRGLVAVRCLGAFEVWRDERILRKGWRNKAREILAYLITRPSGAPKERIIEELWPGIDPEEGSERFDRMASELRSKVRGRDDTGRYVDKEDDVFYLEPGAWWSDAWELERLVSQAERKEQSDEAVTKLREAVALYRGEFCQDYYYPWAEGVRERFRALAVRACGRLADLLSDRGEHDEAIAVLDRGIEADPLCEDLSRRAMAMEASLGRRAAALTRYRKLEIDLDAALSVEPDPETQALVAQLQADSKSG